MPQRSYVFLLTMPIPFVTTVYPSLDIFGLSQTGILTMTVCTLYASCLHTHQISLQKITFWDLGSYGEFNCPTKELKEVNGERGFEWLCLDCCPLIQTWINVRKWMDGLRWAIFQNSYSYYLYIVPTI